MIIDSMRVGGGRCPPLLVGGLVIACIMMVCNWWTLSSTNMELLKQIDELNDQIKISVEERDQYATLRENTEKQLKLSQDDARTTHVKLSQVEYILSACNTELKSYQQKEISTIATLETLRVAKNSITVKLNTQVDENKKLVEELKKVKDELEKVKLTINAPQPTLVPVLPIANPAKHKPSTPNPHLEPVEISAVNISVEGQKGMKYHGIPILPENPPGAVRQQPHYSVTKIKSKILEKSDNKTVNIEGQPTANIGNPPPNAVNIDAQVGPEKDNSDIKEDTAAEVHEGNGKDEFNLNLISDTKIHDNQNKY